MKHTPALLMGLLGMAQTAVWAAPLTFYVSPTGSDANAGTEQKPFATLERARDALRQQNAAARTDGARVVVRGGWFFLKQPFKLEPPDSGTPTAPVIYEAAPGEQPVFSGGTVITGWTQGKGKLWQVELPAAKEGQWFFNQLFVGGQRRQPARHPNEGYLRTEGATKVYKKDRQATNGDKEIRHQFKFKAGELKATWQNMADVRLFLYHSWTASLHWLAEVDEAGRVAKLTNPTSWPIGWWEKDQRYHVEHVREALDAPGEWYLDRVTGRLEYYPMPGEDMSRVQVVAPRLTQLLLVNGAWEQGQLVHDVVLRGLSFQHADWAFQNHQQSVDGQAAIFLTGVMEMRGALRTSLERCEVAHVGTYAVNLEAGCKSNRLFHCHIHDFAGGGVRVGEFMRQSTKAKDTNVMGRAVSVLTMDGLSPRDTGHNVVDNNFIHDGGHVFPGAIGVIVGHSAFNQITHNEISDLNYSGVSVGWVWGFGQSVAHHNRVADNHIHHLGWGVMSDMAGVYTLGISPGSSVAHNYIHHVNAYSYGGWGLYTDEGSSDMIWENNVVHDTKTGGFHQHYGANNQVRNNILAFSREAQVQRSREDVRCHFVFERNIVYCDNDQVLIRSLKNGDYQFDHNLYWTTSQAVPLFDQRPWEEWRATSKQDRNSLLADPMFVNAGQRDFRLEPGSPATKLGFQPINLEGIGLYGEKDWVEAPQRVVRKEFTLPATAAPTPTSIVDDFENTPAGEKPKFGAVMGESGSAGIRVTGELAAGGKQSLKFTDARGLEAAHSPLWQYKLQSRQGMAQASFAVRTTPGAIFWHEWRDAASPYRRGPSIKITDQGRFQAGGSNLFAVPFNTWIRVDLACGLGTRADGKYDLTITIPGQPPKSYPRLATGSKDFKALQWFGFVALAQTNAVFYLDDLKLTTQP